MIFAECPAGSIRCPSGKCGAVCNGVPNCDQAGDAGEDEENCGKTAIGNTGRFK